MDDRLVLRNKKNPASENNGFFPPSERATQSCARWKRSPQTLGRGVDVVDSEPVDVDVSMLVPSDAIGGDRRKFHAPLF